MDCFFAAVEMRDNPAYRNVPIAIGGSVKRRGVISTCNYLARKYGVRSAMATAQALKLCPHLTLVPGRLELYSQVSQQIRQIMQAYSEQIEPLSLDEAFLDVSDSQLFNGSATLIAEDLRQAIFKETGLTASAGVAPIKFAAKIASDENKPDGLCVITPDDLPQFVAELELGKIPGVGKVTLAKLNNMGLFYGRDIQRYSFDKLVKAFGKFGPVLWQRCHGIDPRQISNDRQRKSVGVERTLPQDIYREQDCLALISQLLPKLKQRLAKVQDHQNIRSQGVKLKFADFQQTTVEHRCPCLNSEYFSRLLTEALERQKGRGIRLVGLNIGLMEADGIGVKQLPLCFD